MGLHLLFVIFDLGSLADDDFCLALHDSQSGVESSDEGLHLVFDPSLSHVVAGLVLNKRGRTIKEAG